VRRKRRQKAASGSKRSFSAMLFQADRVSVQKATLAADTKRFHPSFIAQRFRRRQRFEIGLVPDALSCLPRPGTA